LAVLPDAVNAVGLRGVAVSIVYDDETKRRSGGLAACPKVRLKASNYSG
jgi:hypothetical protein